MTETWSLLARSNVPQQLLVIRDTQPAHSCNTWHATRNSATWKGPTGRQNWMKRSFLLGLPWQSRSALVMEARRRVLLEEITRRYSYSQASRTSVASYHLAESTEAIETHQNLKTDRWMMSVVVRGGVAMCGQLCLCRFGLWARPNRIERLSTHVRAHQPRSSRRPSSIKRVVLVIAAAVVSHVKLLFVPHLVNASVSGVRGRVMFVLAKIVFTMCFSFFHTSSRQILGVLWKVQTFVPITH